MTERFHLCLHAHFYQPPRENPWLEAIEIQTTAAPYHDWNERIYAECYLPNASARVLDAKNFITEIANNYEKISFNFGPTLLSWLEKFHPETYQKILEADRISQKEHNGHGNAIAQVFNHVIMPLANRRDKVTQVRWGIDDFFRRFQRLPEAMWLSETACNDETLEVLAEAGMKFCILEPHQADAVRALGGNGEWHDVSSGAIDPKRPYRYFLKNNSGKFIDLFFYDGPISKAMGFEDLLFEAKRFMGRIENAVVNDRRAQLIHMATDGETYGHHKAFGERVIAYLTRVEAPKRSFYFVNYGEFLEICPPRDEVKIKEGENGEGTSWSCEHGVKRWKEHCGCRGGGHDSWQQHWRKNLRQSFDWLRDELLVIYEAEGSRYLKDVWEARNDYSLIFLDRSAKNREEFFGKHAVRELNPAEKVICLKLLECQRHAMLMYTSCGWFFTEISGIETIQVIEYAARALQLAEESSGRVLEAEFLARLSYAKSNIHDWGDARKIYEKMVKPKKLILQDLAAFYAMISLLEEVPENSAFYSYEFFPDSQHKESFGDLTAHSGIVRVRSNATLEEETFIFAAVQTGLYDVRCSVRKSSEVQGLEQFEKDFFKELHSLHLVELFRKMDEVFGERYYSLKDLPLEERMRVIKKLTREGTEKLNVSMEQLFEDSRRLHEVYRSINLPIPEQIRYAAKHTLRKRLREAGLALAGEGFDPHKAQPVYRLLETARAFEVDLQQGEIVKFLSRELEKRLRSLHNLLKKETIQECLNIRKIAKKMKLELEKGRSQEQIYFLLKSFSQVPDNIPGHIRVYIPDLLQLAHDLHIQTDSFKKGLQP